MPIPSALAFKQFHTCTYGRLQPTQNDSTQMHTSSTTIITTKALKASKIWLYYPVQARKVHGFRKQILKIPFLKKKINPLYCIYMLTAYTFQTAASTLSEDPEKETQSTAHSTTSLSMDSLHIQSSSAHSLTILLSLSWSIPWQWTPPQRPLALYPPKLHNRYLADLHMNHRKNATKCMIINLLAQHRCLQ